MKETLIINQLWAYHSQIKHIQEALIRRRTISSSDHSLRRRDQQMRGDVIHGGIIQLCYSLRIIRVQRDVNVTRCQRHDAFKGEPEPLTIVVVSLRFNPPI